MARFTATWTNTNDGDWAPADLVKTDKFRDQVGQNIEHIAQTHNHDPLTANRGGALVNSEAEEIMFRLGAA